MNEDYNPTRQIKNGGSSSSPSGQSGMPEYNPTKRMDNPAGYGGIPAQPWGGHPAGKTEVLRPQGPVTLAWLVIVNGPYTGHIFHLRPDATVIGRDPGCDIVLDDTAVSREHAKVRVTEGEEKQVLYVLHDMASENGVLLNGEAAIKSNLKDGDSIVIGRTELVFKQVVPKKNAPKD